jgi:hypothetical protein
MPVRSDVLPVNSDVVIPVKSSVHVHEADSVNELVENNSESEAATSNSVWLKSKPLGSTTTANKRCTTHRITVDVDVVLNLPWLLVENKSETSALIEVTSSSVNFRYLSGVWNNAKFKNSQWKPEDVSSLNRVSLIQ